MKKIIDGRRYDTETSTLVANASDGHPNDFRYWDEDLYRTPNGRWFVHGSGGPNSRWAETTECGRSRSDGEDFLVLTPEDALEWLTLNGKTNAIEQYFASAVQDA